MAKQPGELEAEARADAELGAALERVGEHRRRRTFLAAFAQDPVGFFTALVAAQSRDLRVAAGREGEAWEVLPPGEVFRERWVEDAVMRYMAEGEAARAAAAAPPPPQGPSAAQVQQQQQLMMMAAMRAAVSGAPPPKVLPGAPK